MRLPTGDLSQRLLQNGGRQPGGLFRPGQVAAREVAGAGAELEQLRAMLRELVNVNVRPPSHIAPPFRSEPWLHQAFYSASATTQSGAVTFNGNAAVPNGFNAVVQAVQFFAAIDAAQANGPPVWTQDVSLRVLVDGNGVPGLNAMRPAFFYWAPAPVPPGERIFTGCDIPPPALSPLPLRAGQSLSYVVTNSNAGAATFTAFVQVFGYVYPIEVDDDGIRGTLADRDR